MEFRILGPLEVVADGEPLQMGTPRQRTVLGLLLARAGRIVSTDRLAEDLWEGALPETARHSLQVYVHRLRQALGAEAWRLQSRPPGYQLKVSVDELDVLRFEQLAADGHRALVRGDTEVAVELLETAVGLWRGSFLSDLPGVTALEPERARLEGLRLTTVEERIEADLRLGRHRVLAEEIQALLNEHPYRERLWGQLMLALYRTGRQGDAVQTFRQAQEVLAQRLGLDPSPWLSRLHERILLQDAGLEASAAEHVARTDVPHAVPEPRDTFVGRQREGADLHGLIRTRRLVTLTGPPGCGKTRMAIELGLDLLDEFPHGVFFVPLADIEDPDRVAVTIAGALGLATGGRPATEALTDHLRSRRTLLILDNFEHLLPGAPVVARLLDTAPQLTVLATSRAPLRLTGEQEYPLGALPVRNADAAPHPAPNDAVALFADRAGAVDPRFVLDGDTAPVVAAVVERLDGLPLAIELAAARLRVFPLEELHRRLDPALPLLTGGPADAAERQRTLEDAIRWSDELLAPDERTTLRRLGVFRGGFTTDAAEWVVSNEEIPDVVAGLSALVEAGLLQRPTGGYEGRFTMLETVREYAIERLREAGEHDDVASRHHSFHADLVRQAEPELAGSGQGAWLERLDQERANLAAALRWVRQHDPEQALDMAGRMWRFWQLRGHLHEGRRWLEDVLDADASPRVARIKALVGLAGICYWQSDLDTARTAYREAADLAAKLDDWPLELEALTGLIATIACHRGDLDAAAPVEQEIETLVEEHPEPFAVGMRMAASMLVRLFAGDLEGARAVGEPLVAACRQMGERWYEAEALRTLGLTSLIEGNARLAEDELRQALELANDAGDAGGMAMDLDRLGQAAVARGEAARGVVLAGAASRLRDQLGGGGLTVETFRWETEPPREAARRSLDDVEIETAWARGRSMTQADAVAYARSS